MMSVELRATQPANLPAILRNSGIRNPQVRHGNKMVSGKDQWQLIT